MLDMEDHQNPNNSPARRRKLSKLNVVKFAISHYKFNDFSSNDLAFFIREELDEKATEMNIKCGKSSSTRKGWAVQQKIGSCLHTLQERGWLTKTTGRSGYLWHKTPKLLAIENKENSGLQNSE